jgi:hypothetical protein
LFPLRARATRDGRHYRPPVTRFLPAPPRARSRTATSHPHGRSTILAWADTPTLYLADRSTLLKQAGDMAVFAMYAAAALGRMSRAATTAAVAVLVVSLSLPLLAPFGATPPAGGAAAQELGRRFRFTHARTQHQHHRRE